MGIIREKFQEISDEFNQIAKGHISFFEAILPIFLFLFLNHIWGLRSAAVISFLTGMAFTLTDILRRRRKLYSLGGLVLLGMAILAVIRSGKAGSVLLPSIGSNGIISIICILSLVARKPMVAWTSYFARHYPLAWYWHPAVRPAYTEVTIVWALFFGIRALLQFSVAGSENIVFVSLFSLISGWPSTLMLLVISYLYGIWRLRVLGGPGVDEFRRGDPPPWKGQKRGF